jgi:hypothetical protein
MLFVFEINSDFDYLSMSIPKELSYLYKIARRLDICFYYCNSIILTFFAIDSFDYEYMICFRVGSYYKCCGFCKLMTFLSGLILKLGHQFFFKDRNT